MMPRVGGMIMNQKPGDRSDAKGRAASLGASSPARRGILVAVVHLLARQGDIFG